MNPLHLFSIYFKTIKENQESESLPLSEHIRHFAFPGVIAFALLWFASTGGLSEAAVTFLLTIHGILISVLMASFTPFIEKLDQNNTTGSLSAEEQEFSRSLKIAKKLVFSANSLAIFVSLLIIVLLLLSLSVNTLFDKSFPIYEISIPLNTFFYSFYALLFFLICFNACLILRTVHILSDIVMARLDK